MPVSGGRWRRAARLGGLATGLAADAAGVLALRGSAAFHRQAASRLAQALGEMKGLPHKVGQVLSVLDDAIPAEHRQVYAEVLGRLQAHAVPLPWSELRPVLAAELGADPDRVFDWVDPVPAAAASIGQVHRARLPSGQEVALKLQYPGVAEALAADLANLGGLVAALSAVLPAGSVDHLVRDVADRFREELDYPREARVQAAWAARWAGDAQVGVPAPLLDLCGRRLLVSAWVDGLDFEQAREASEEERSAWGAAMWRFTWRGVLEHGWLHADPHPGNYRFQPGGRLWVLDYGCTQALPEAMVEGLATLGRAAVAGAEDRELLPPLARALDLPAALDPALEAVMARLARLIVLPMSAPQPFRFDREYSGLLFEQGAQAKLAMAGVALRRGLATPRSQGSVLLLRTALGLAAVLSRLEARADFRAAAGLG